MALPEVVSREQWVQARLRLLEQETELTRRRDALNAEIKQWQSKLLRTAVWSPLP